jgi:hypothetical protein
VTAAAAGRAGGLLGSPRSPGWWRPTVLVPLVCTLALVGKRQLAAAAATLAWTGQSLADVAVYVADGKAMALPLLADDLTHDWNYILGTLGWLDHAARLGRLTFGLGLIAMSSALVILALDLYAACYPPTVTQDSR